jgi:hypothetical protein
MPDVVHATATLAAVYELKGWRTGFEPATTGTTTLLVIGRRSSREVEIA